VALPLRKQIKNIQNFLKAFEYAMRLKDIPPKVSGYSNKTTNINLLVGRSGVQ
jgi:hypothetical protein